MFQEQSDHPLYNRSKETRRRSPHQGLMDLFAKNGMTNDVSGIEVTFYDGVKLVWVELDNGDTDTYEVQREVGRIRSRLVYVKNLPSEVKYDPISERYTNLETYSSIQEYTFNSRVKRLYNEILRIITETGFSRVIQTDEQIVVCKYSSLPDDDFAKFKELVTPLPNQIVAFTQGEWVVVEATDQNHKIASLGRNPDACRYWMVYDPIMKRVAATHLDLLHDIEVVHEMAGQLLRAGSVAEHLKVFGSSNAAENVKKEIKLHYPSVHFHLDASDFIFDVSTGEQTLLDKETLDHMIAAKIGDRVNFETRRKYEIPHRLAYQSPQLN